ncbi:hypothetical protein IWZ01DRAFT_554262 [Phyllosticta capitalensis]
MQLHLPHLALLATFGVSLLGGVSAAPISPSGPSHEGKAVDIAFAGLEDAEQPKMRAKRDEGKSDWLSPPSHQLEQFQDGVVANPSPETSQTGIFKKNETTGEQRTYWTGSSEGAPRNEKGEIDWSSWSSVRKPYNWSESAWSESAINQNRIEKTQNPQWQTVKVADAATAPGDKAQVVEVAQWQTVKGADAAAAPGERVLVVEVPQQPEAQVHVVPAPKNEGQVLRKRDGEDGEVAAKSDDLTNAGVERVAQKGVVVDPKEEGEGERLSERTQEPSATQELLPFTQPQEMAQKAADAWPDQKTYPKIPDDMYDDIIATAIVARFSAEDKLAIRAKPAGPQQLAKMHAMVERKVRRVVLGLFKTERRNLRAGAIDKGEAKKMKKTYPDMVRDPGFSEKTLRKDLPEVHRDPGFGGLEEECRPKQRQMAKCVLAVWMMAVMGVERKTVVHMKSPPMSMDPLAPEIQIRNFMDQRGPDSGFWKKWYEEEKKRMEAFPVHEANVSKQLKAVVKDAMARGRQVGSGVGTDLQWRLNELPGESDKLARFFSMLYHRADHLKMSRAAKEEMGIQRIT